MVDPYTGKQVKEGKSKAPLGAASESAAVGKPWSYALRGLCILPARPVVMIQNKQCLPAFSFASLLGAALYYPICLCYSAVYKSG